MSDPGPKNPPGGGKPPDTPGGGKPPDTPGGGKPAVPPGRDRAREVLGNRWKDPKGLTIAEGADRFREVAKANSGGKTAAAACRAFGSVPANWKTKEIL